MPVTAFYASLLTALFVVLSLRVIGRRRGAGAAFGDGGDKELLRRIRAQGNFAEYAPLNLVLLGLAEGLLSPTWLLHLLGLVLLAGRLLHAYGISRSNEQFVFRVSGMVSTFMSLTGAALVCFVAALARLF